MNILHITEDNSITNYGITTVVNDLNQYLKNQNINSKTISPIINTNDKETIYTKPTFNKPIWRHSFELKDYLKTNTVEQLLHIHGIWMYPQYITSKIAYNTNTPYIITAHGMLEPWVWNKNTLKKKIYFNLMIKKYFSNANVLHAITPNEKDNLYKLFKHKHIEIIPNSISYLNIINKNIKRDNQEKYILFLGRLDTIKGINLLIQAFSKIQNNKDITLKIAGPINEYKKTLDTLVKSLNLEKRIKFLGMVTGDEKLKLYKNAWVFVAPSFSEVVGMVNLEAGVLETPVITTYQTGLYKEWNDNGGALINPNVLEITSALENSLSWSDEERADRGKKLKKFIIEHYSWEKNINKWTELYKGLN